MEAPGAGSCGRLAAKGASRMKIALVDGVRATLRRVGLDRAIAWTVAARATSILGSTGTVLLIVRFLSPAEQGYYYTLLSLVNLQIVFELGFSFVIQQFAAHECIRLTLHSSGRIDGDPAAHARLALMLRKTVQWYLVAALLMGVALLPLGLAFFSRPRASAQPVAWQWPLHLTVFACVVAFALDPLLSFLDGCGQVRQVAFVRFGQAAAAVVAAWSALAAHHGLFSPGLVILGTAMVAVAFLWSRRRLLLGLLFYPAPPRAISWRKEIWSFQWKIAVSWLCSYFTVQIFTPILFLARGPAEAGRMGMSLSITSYLWGLVLAWMSTKATPFGCMIARGEFARLDRLFFRTLRQSLAVLATLAVLCMAGVLTLSRLDPRLANRMVSPAGFALLLPAALGAFIIQCEAIYLRAHQFEPFLWQSIAVALLTLGGVSVAAPRWGALGAAATYFLSTGVVGLASATAIFRARRRTRVTHAQEAMC
jgi:O-antigen/teichoic acid export membrane protein